MRDGSWEEIKEDGLSKEYAKLTKKWQMMTLDAGAPCRKF